jgi:hypothetical protein
VFSRRKQQWLDVADGQELWWWWCCRRCGARRDFITDSRAHILEFLEYVLREKGVRYIEEDDGTVIDIVEALEAGRRVRARHQESTQF